jgi:hypothetical protein
LSSRLIHRMSLRDLTNCRIVADGFIPDADVFRNNSRVVGIRTLDPTADRTRPNSGLRHDSGAMPHAIRCNSQSRLLEPVLARSQHPVEDIGLAVVTPRSSHMRDLMKRAACSGELVFQTSVILLRKGVRCRKSLYRNGGRLVGSNETHASRADFGWSSFQCCKFRP